MGNTKILSIEKYFKMIVQFVNFAVCFQISELGNSPYTICGHKDDIVSPFGV